MKSITAIVQSMMASSQEVNNTWRDRNCPPLCTLPAFGRRHARAQHAKWQPACLGTRNDLAPLLRVYSEQLALISDIVPDASLAVDHRAMAGGSNAGRHRSASARGSIGRSAGISPMWERREHRQDVSRLLSPAAREIPRAFWSSGQS